MSNAIYSPKDNLTSIGALLANRQPQIKKALPGVGGIYTHEFQVFGDRLTRELDDEAHRGLYMKLAKYEPRGLLENALFFVRDAKTNKPAALFMWRLQQLKQKGSGASKSRSRTI